MAGAASGATTGDAAPTRNARRRERTMQAILDAGEALFLEHGYAGVRVEDVATRADVAVGSVYVHAESKRGLYVLVVQRALDRLEAYLAQAYQPGVPPWLQVIATGELYLAFALDHPGYHRLLAFPPFGSATDLGVALEPLAERVDALVARLAGAVAAAAGDGALRTGDPGATATVLWGAWTGLLAHLTRPDRTPVSPERMAALFTAARALVAEGIATPALRDHEGRLLPQHDVGGL